MNFETAADSWIRPHVGHQPVPRFGLASASQLPAANPAEGAEVLAAEPTSEEFGFADLLDVVNPLQHLPLVSTLYRALTGDEIKAPARIVGGFLFGGPTGFVASIANAVSEEVSGRDLGETALAFFFGEDEAGETDVAAAFDAGIEPAAAQLPGEAADRHPPLPTATPAAFGIDPAPAAVPAGGPAGHGQVPPLELLEPGEAPLNGVAALRAYLRDMNRISPPGAVDVAPVPPLPGPETVQKAERVPANLGAAGNRDKRGSGQIASPYGAVPLASGPPATASGPPPLQRPSSGQAAPAPDRQQPSGPHVSPLRGTDPTLFVPTAPGEDISSLMLDALKKYETMMKQRHGQSKEDSSSSGR